LAGVDRENAQKALDSIRARALGDGSDETRHRERGDHCRDHQCDPGSHGDHPGEDRVADPPEQAAGDQVGLFLLVDTDPPRRARRGLCGQDEHDARYCQQQAHDDHGGVPERGRGGSVSVSASRGPRVPSSSAAGNSTPPRQAGDPARPVMPWWPVARQCAQVRNPEARTSPTSQITSAIQVAVVLVTGRHRRSRMPCSHSRSRIPS
jgi:hypothetical protein